MQPLRRAGRIVLVTGLAMGCASSPSTTSPPAATPTPVTSPAATTPAAAPASAAPGDIVLQEVKDLGGRVWLAPGFAFRDVDTLVIGETRAEVPRLAPDGAENLEWSRGVLRNELIFALQERKLFTVVTADAEAKPGARVLRLENTIIEYAKGGGGARFWAGLYGAGQPVIRVRGRLTDGDRVLFVYEARRSGDSGTARMFGGYRSDKDIQEEDIRDLAKDLADFIARTKGP